MSKFLELERDWAAVSQSKFRTRTLVMRTVRTQMWDRSYLGWTARQKLGADGSVDLCASRAAVKATICVPLEGHPASSFLAAPAAPAVPPTRPNDHPERIDVLHDNQSEKNELTETT